MRLTSGTRVRRYEIDSLLGVGGMGQVYFARDVELGRTVALTASLRPKATTATSAAPTSPA